MNKQSFKKENKIHTSKEINQLFKIGKIAKEENLKINWIDHEERSSKFGVIVSKKIKGAVVRNRYKRLLREFYRLNRTKINKSIDFIVYIFKPIKTLKYEEIEQKMTKIMQKAKLI